MLFYFILVQVAEINSDGKPGSCSVNCDGCLQQSLDDIFNGGKCCLADNILSNTGQIGQPLWPHDVTLPDRSDGQNYKKELVINQNFPQMAEGLSNSLADNIFGLFTVCKDLSLRLPLPSYLLLSSASPSVLRLPIRLQWECFLLYEEQLTPKNTFHE